MRRLFFTYGETFVSPVTQDNSLADKDITDVDEALKVVMTHMHELNYGFYKGTTRYALLRAVCVDRDEVTPEEEGWLRTCHNNRPDTAVYPPIESDPTANGKV